jgi:NTE family protein
VGAAYAAEELDRLEPWVAGLSWQTVVGLLDVSMNGGLIKGDKVLNFFRARFQDKDISQLGRAFGAVATELVSGREVWLREGSVVDAVRASLAVPGLFRPAVRDGRLLVDGALVNPVPVSLCRAMGADVVIAVDLNWDLMGRRLRAARLPAVAPADAPGNDGPSLLERLSSGWGKLKSAASAGDPEGAAAAPVQTGPNLPSMLEVLTTSLNIMQVRITSSRLAGEPADILIDNSFNKSSNTFIFRKGVSINKWVAPVLRVSISKSFIFLTRSFRSFGR